MRQVGISRFLLLANSPCSATDSSEQMNSDAYQPIYRWKALDFSFPTVYGLAYIRVHLFLRFCSTRSEPHFLVGINRKEFLLGVRIFLVAHSSAAIRRVRIVLDLVLG